MTPDQSWLSVWADSVPGELLFLLIPLRSGLLTAAACVFRPVHGEVSSYLSDTWTPWLGSLLPLLSMACCDAECWRRQTQCIGWVNSCIRWWNSRSGTCWDNLRLDYCCWKQEKQVIYSSELIQISNLSHEIWKSQCCCVSFLYISDCHMVKMRSF